MLSPTLLGCSGPPMLTGEISGTDILIPADSFVIPNSNPGETTKFRDCVIVSNKELEFPICVFRFSETRYSALWMRCTHQGAELDVFGDRLECPAHGSVFTATGVVLNGPATQPLRSFPVALDHDSLKISLKKA